MSPLSRTVDVFLAYLTYVLQVLLRMGNPGSRDHLSIHLHGSSILPRIQVSCFDATIFYRPRRISLAFISNHVGSWTDQDSR
jgi:hypothetical protein